MLLPETSDKPRFVVGSNVVGALEERGVPSSAREVISDEELRS